MHNMNALKQFISKIRIVQNFVMISVRINAAMAFKVYDIPKIYFVWGENAGDDKSLSTTSKQTYRNQLTSLHVFLRSYLTTTPRVFCSSKNIS